MNLKQKYEIEWLYFGFLLSKILFKLHCGKKRVQKMGCTMYDYPLKEPFYRMGPFVEKQCYDQQKTNRCNIY